MSYFKRNPLKIAGILLFIFILIGFVLYSVKLTQKKTQTRSKADEEIDRCSLDIEVIEETPTPPPATITPISPTNTPPAECSCIPAYYCTYGILKDCGNGDACCLAEPTSLPLPTR